MPCVLASASTMMRAVLWLPSACAALSGDDHWRQCRIGCGFNVNELRHPDSKPTLTRRLCANGVSPSCSADPWRKSFGVGFVASSSNLWSKGHIRIAKLIKRRTVGSHKQFEKHELPFRKWLSEDISLGRGHRVLWVCRRDFLMCRPKTPCSGRSCDRTRGEMCEFKRAVLAPGAHRQ
jgi:hypothetical protein